MVIGGRRITLIIPASNIEMRAAELDHVEQWAAANNLRLNRRKSTEIVFVDPQRRRSVVPPSPLTGVTRASSKKMLGVKVTKTSSVDEHVRATIHVCASSMHALRVLWSHGLNDPALQTVYRVAVVARLTYTTSAWWGFTTADDRQHIEWFLRRGICAGFHRPDWPGVENLAEDADDALFRGVLGSRNHLLHSLLPDKNRHGYDLRHRCHDRILTSNHDQRNFLDRQLHKYSY